MRLIDIEGELRERMSRKQQHLMQLFDSNGKLELEVQKAYRDHMAKTFEEVVLGMDEVL